MLAERTPAAVAGACERERIEPGPPGSAASARVCGPARLRLADHRHATGWWRGLRLDGALHGLAVERARPSAVAIEHAGSAWTLPVDGPLDGLAWHPRRPLVAGLATRGGHARPWVADYARRQVRVFATVRAATSLTGLERGAGAPLCWLDERTLAFLGAPSAPPPPPAPPAGDPLIFDAAGPGFVSFEPGLDALAVAARAVVTLLDVDAENGAIVTAAAEGTPALLIRRLEPVGGAPRALLVCHATAAGRGTGADALTWSTARLDLTGRRPTLATLPACGAPSAPAARNGRPAGDSHDAAPRRSTRTHLLALPAARHQARLAVFAPRTHPEPRAATLLWLRAARGPQPRAAVALPVPDTRAGTAVLDLPLHWPTDATPAALHDQIAGAVTAARAALGDDAPVVVGGHSFGATLALYALAHVPGLAGAIAHSGCYNRTHTAYGFHFEQRSYWQAPEIYAAFSALRFADQLTRPVLLVHGLEDVNPATHPDQAAELYRAIVANGGTARLVLLPHEEHSFRYRETDARLAALHEHWLARAAAAAAADRAGSTDAP